jgi:hypothetical protein
MGATFDLNQRNPGYVGSDGDPLSGAIFFSRTGDTGALADLPETGGSKANFFNWSHRLGSHWD